MRRTGDIALFKITAEGAVAAGIRRIEALTGEAALEHVNAEERLLGEAAGALKVRPQELPERVRALLAERRRLEQRGRRSCARSSPTGGGAGGRAAGAWQIARHAVRRARESRACRPRTCARTADAIQRQIGTGVVAVVSVVDGKAALVVSVSEDLDRTRSMRSPWCSAGVAELGGKGGGGRPDFAQGGGPDGAQAEAALAAIERALAGHAAAAE